MKSSCESVRAFARRFFRDEGGAAAVEIGAIAPILILMCFGIVEIARYENFSIMTVNAARAGVQYGAQNLVTAVDNAGMQTAALADAQNIAGLTATAKHYCQCSDGSTSACLASDCPAPLHRIVWVQVDTTGAFNSLLNFPGLPANITVGGTAIMRNLQQ
ncbi:MAG: hypothetical protein NVS2B17_02040 [Candidatus Velthaea sp.]